MIWENKCDAGRRDKNCSQESLDDVVRNSANIEDALAQRDQERRGFAKNSLLISSYCSNIIYY